MRADRTGVLRVWVRAKRTHEGPVTCGCDWLAACCLSVGGHACVIALDAWTHRQADSQPSRKCHATQFMQWQQQQ